MGSLFICAFIFIASVMLTWLVRAYSIRQSILDIPNERSSHTIPTPRGGGVAIVLLFLSSVLCLGWQGSIPTSLVLAIIGGGTVIAALGYCDDVYSVKTRTRIIVHFAMALWALYWLGGFNCINMWFGSILALIGIVWCTNFYNFMDGIDGLAGSEGLVVAVGGSIALWALGENNLALVYALLASTIAGFTVWNWPPAKIFMGDVGSGFLGYIFAVLALYSVNNTPINLAFWWILLGVFIWDATFTVISRGIKGKRWYEAHREHAYQRLTALGATHKQVTLGIFLINCGVLLPLAFTTLMWHGVAGWLLAFTTLGLWLAWFTINSTQLGHES